MTAEFELAGDDELDARQFLIAVKRLADSLAYGTHPSIFVGSGIEYAQSRPYEPSDSVKSMDWKVTARTGKYYVKEYEAPKQMPALILLDTSASMTIASTPKTKYAIAVQIVSGVALACLAHLQPVAVIGVGERDLSDSPTLSRTRILKRLHELRRYRLDEQTRLGRRIREMSPRLRQRSLIVVCSDLNDDAALSSIKALAQQHDCVVIQLRDPAEIQLRGVGFIRGMEAETGRPFVTRGRSLGFDQTLVESELKRARVDHLVVRTDVPFEHRLRMFFKSRGVLGRGTR